MNVLLLLALVAAAAAATVANKQEPTVAKVAEVTKEAEVFKITEESVVDDETEGFIYDEFGVPMRTLPASRQSLTAGVIGPDDRLVSRITHNVAAAQFIIHNQDVTFHGAHQTNITAIQVDRVGNTMHAIPSIKSGGLGQSFVVINILGVRGSGFSYTISIYASIGCANS